MSQLVKLGGHLLELLDGLVVLMGVRDGNNQPVDGQGPVNGISNEDFMVGISQGHVQEHIDQTKVGMLTSNIVEAGWLDQPRCVGWRPSLIQCSCLLRKVMAVSCRITTIIAWLCRTSGWVIAVGRTGSAS